MWLAQAAADEASTKLESCFQKVEAPWLVEGVFEAPFYTFYLGAPAVKGVAYVPNFAPRLGTRLVYKDFGSTLTMSLPIPKAEIERRGDSTQASLVFNSYWRQFAFDVYYQRFRGFYAASPFTELSVHKPERYPQVPDAQVLNYGMNWYLVWNPEDYSLKAAFDLSEFQTRSSGSWIAQPFYNHLEMLLGSGFIAGTDPNAIPHQPNLGAGRFDTLGTALGYGYTFVHGHFFTSAQGAYGPGIQFQRIKRTDADYSNVWSLAAKLNVNVAAGWNYADYVGGLKLMTDSIWAKVLDTQVSSSVVSAQLFFGRRF